MRHRLDHLQTPSKTGIRPRWPPRPRRVKPVVATLLPITTWFLMKGHHAPARAFVDGVPVAIGTDFNPGTSPAPNLTLAMSFAVVNLGLAGRGAGQP